MSLDRLAVMLYLFLAFPSGRLRTLGNRLLVATSIVATLAFFVPWALLTPVIAGGGPLSGCRPACPANVLQVGSSAAAVELLGRWETYAMLALIVAILGVYWTRVTAASRPQRRALIAVAVSSLLFLPSFFVYHFSRLILDADAATLEPMAWALVGIRVVLPLGFLAALFQAELFAGAARGRLLEQLLRRPSPRQWREAVAVALDDPPVQIAFWDPAAERYREAAPPRAVVVEYGQAILDRHGRGAVLAADARDELRDRLLCSAVAPARQAAHETSRCGFGRGHEPPLTRATSWRRLRAPGRRRARR
jgi:hypothetical protein